MLKTNFDIKSSSYEMLEASNKVEIEQFEKHFYNAFCKLPSQNLIRKIWIWNDELQQIRCKIEYEKLFICSWKNANGEPIAYGVVKKDLLDFSQYEYYGFQTPDSQSFPNPAEVLVFFKTHFAPEGVDLHQDFLKNYCYGAMKDLGFQTLLATCSNALLSLYTFWHWKLLDTKEINNEVRHFLYFHL